MTNLNSKEKKVLNVLNAAGRPLNTNQVAERSDMSWTTAKKYLKRLYGKKYLRKKSKGKATYWRLR
jgi:DNA-binding IclR family transcriptional regulator